jgi:hypothetical protein
MSILLLDIMMVEVNMKRKTKREQKREGKDMGLLLLNLVGHVSRGW